MTDDFKFDLHCTPLKPSLVIAFTGHKIATHFKKDKKRFTFAWHENAGAGFTPFPVPCDVEMAEMYIKKWLEHEAEYGPVPPSDGESKSWHIWTETWGHIDHNHYAFFAVEPYWATYSK